MESSLAKFSEAQSANYEHQIAMNPVTLARLTELGLTAETLVSLDFAYLCPSQGSMQALLPYLRAETDYDLTFVFDRGCELRGTTQPRAITLDSLNQWVLWMCQAGVEHGDCQFDGWGTSIPKANNV